MAERHEGVETPGFTAVNRRIGTAFRYLLLAATLTGIVSLAVLLLYVASDAIRPFSASLGWAAIAFLALLGAPTAVSAAVGYRRPSSLQFGLATIGLLVVGLLYGGGASIVFIDVVPPIVWLSAVITLCVPVGVLLALDRMHQQPSFLAKTALILGSGAASVALVPGVVQSIPVLPADWIITWLTVGGPGSLVFSWFVGSRTEGRRPSRVAGGGLFLALGLLGVLGTVTGVGGTALVALATVGFLPVVTYVWATIHRRPGHAIGLTVPATLLVGAGILRASERFLGVSGPTSWFDWQFLTSTQTSPPAAGVGIYPAIVGTILLMVTVVVVSFPVGVGAAVYLEEYAPDTRFTRIIQVNISNLAGVPSVVYGLLGLGAFIRFGGLGPGTVVVGGLTLALLILPIVIINAREALRGVPDSRRRASYGLGATRWQTVRDVVLPEAFPGILTGTILALGRAVGETAPLVVIGAPAIFGIPNQFGDRVGAIPVQIYAWASTFGDPKFYTTVLAAGVLTILIVMLTMNSIAIVLRNRYELDT